MLLMENTKVKCEGVVIDNPELEDRFQKLLGPDPGHEKELAALKKEKEQMLATIENLQAAVDPKNCRVIMGNLRSGANVETQGSLMVIGDVKPGASVTAGGSVFVLGALQGNADAGAYGDRNAFIFGSHTASHIGRDGYSGGYGSQEKGDIFKEGCSSSAGGRFDK